MIFEINIELSWNLIIWQRVNFIDFLEYHFTLLQLKINLEISNSQFIKI